MLDIFDILHFYQYLNPWPGKITCNQPRGSSTLPCEAMAHSHKWVDSTAGGMSGCILCKGTVVSSFRDETLGAVCPHVERRVDTVVTDERVCLV